MPEAVKGYVLVNLCLLHQQWNLLVQHEFCKTRKYARTIPVYRTKQSCCRCWQWQTDNRFRLTDSQTYTWLVLVSEVYVLPFKIDNICPPKTRVNRKECSLFYHRICWIVNLLQPLYLAFFKRLLLGVMVPVDSLNVSCLRCSLIIFFLLNLPSLSHQGLLSCTWDFPSCYKISGHKNNIVNPIVPIPNTNCNVFQEKVYKKFTIWGKNLHVCRILSIMTTYIPLFCHRFTVMW